VTDVSPDFVYNETDAKIGRRLIHMEATPKAIVEFDRKARKLTDYAYWFFLGTLWVSYTGFSDLARWRRLFSSTRPKRETSLMKPSERGLFLRLPDPVVAYRAHRPEETDWIAYTVDAMKAADFARQRGVSEVVIYEIARADVLAFFTRRGEWEIIVLNREKAVRSGSIKIILQ
jgi:hypothetical protein